MKRSPGVGGLLKLVGVNVRADVTSASYSSNLDARPPQSNGRLPIIEIDIEFEDLEEKTAPQSDTSYLDRTVEYR